VTALAIARGVIAIAGALTTIVFFRLGRRIAGTPLPSCYVDATGMHFRRSRMIRRAMTAFTAALALGISTVQTQTPPEITRYELPADVTFPEGIAYDAKRDEIYTGSAATGNLVRLTLASKQAAVVSPPASLMATEPFPALLGMKLDSAGRVWIAGGRTGQMVVVDARTGKPLKKFEVPTRDASLINDVVVVGPSAYFTDSLTPTLWRVTTTGDRIGDLEPWLQFAGSPLEYTKGANLNGIAATQDGRHLVVVQMNKGLLFRIGVEDKQIVPIDIGGESVATGDGLVLDGRTLYVVRQGEQEIVTIDLAADLSKGRVVSRFKDPALAWPATAVKVGDRLLVVNTQFNRRGTKDPVLPFSIIGVPVALLSGKARP
jgi:Cu-Zn family superoxide dismutase